MIIKLPLIWYYTMIISRVLSITTRQSRKVYYSSTENTAVKVDVLGCTIFMHMAFQRGSSSQNSVKYYFVSLTCWVLRLNNIWKKVYMSHINKIRVLFYAISCFISHPWRLLNVSNFLIVQLYSNIPSHEFECLWCYQYNARISTHNTFVDQKMRSFIYWR